MSDAAAATGGANNAPISPLDSPMAGAVPPSEVRARMSDMGNPAFKPQWERPAAPVQAREPQQQPPTPEVAEGEPLPVFEGDQPAEPQPEGDQPTPEQLAAEWQRVKDSPDLDLETFGDKTIWLDMPDGPQPIRLKDIKQNVLLYRDYQKKTTELARTREQVEGKGRAIDAFAADLQRGPEGVLQALRWAGAEKSFHGAVVQYVQRMAMLEGMPEPMRQQFLEGERARDKAEMLERQLQAREAAERAAQERQAQEQGPNAPDIAHVTAHIEARLPELLKAVGIQPGDELFDGELGQVMWEATQGERGPDGRWRTAPVMQRGRTPTDDVLRSLVTEARQRYDAKLARATGRQPPRPQLPPVAAARVTGPAAQPGQRGNISQPQRRAWSDMK